jgi:hypothetical protein
LNDYVLIKDLSGLNKPKLLERLNALGDEAAGFLEGQARVALKKYGEVMVLVHVPPFREACRYEGQISNEEYLPHFACQAVGERLAAVMREHPDKRMTVLCGHTHGAWEARILDNLAVLTGGAEYYKPVVQRVFEVGGER